MSTRLKRHLAGTREVPDRIEGLADDAINNLPPLPATIEDWRKFEIFLAQIHCHVENHVLGVAERPPDLRVDLPRARRLLHHVFEGSAPQAAFEIARTGINGGVLYLVRAMAHAFAREYADNLISLAVEAYCTERSVSELLADADEYVASYRHLLPSEIAEGSAARIHANIRNVLKQHPFVERRIRRGIGQSNARI